MHIPKFRSDLEKFACMFITLNEKKSLNIMENIKG